MFLKLKWVKILPDYMRPQNNKIEQLEKLRKQHGIPHEVFAMRVQSSRATTRKIQRHFLEEYRRLSPDASEKELRMMVLLSRTDALKNYLLADMATGGMAQEEAKNKIDEFSKILEEFQDVIKKIDSFEEFCEYIINVDERLLGESYSFKIIDEILEE